MDGTKIGEAYTVISKEGIAAGKELKSIYGVSICVSEILLFKIDYDPVVFHLYEDLVAIGEARFFEPLATEND